MVKAAILSLFIILLFVGCGGEQSTQADLGGEDSRAALSKQVQDQINEYSDIDMLSPADVCEHGTLDGQWIRNSIFSDDGTFHGLWIDQDGEYIGYYHGQYWATPDNQRLFSGEISGYITDQVLGYMFGIWYYDDPRLCPMCGTGHGQFRGYFYYLEQTGKGLLKGEFGWADDVLQDTLPMTGVWKFYCFPVTDAASD
jgi:hypothetical protein